MTWPLRAARGITCALRRARLSGCYTKEGKISCYNDSSPPEEAFIEHAKPGH